MDTLIAWRNFKLALLYRLICKPFFFRRDPEEVHDRMTKVGEWLGHYRLTRKLTSWLFGYQHPTLGQNLNGINFPNPVGLAAGFDKDALLTDILPSVGFGFIEVGSITALPCIGNPKPRLWRLPLSQSLVVYYGLKNEGCEVIARRLATKKFAIPLGTSVAMTNIPANMDIATAINDYATAFQAFVGIGGYTTVNISCPNTSHDQPFMDPANLDQLLTVLDGIPTSKPIFLKMSPDLEVGQLEKIVAVVRRHRVHGFICSNLTKNRNNPKIIEQKIPLVGSFSGKVVADAADQLLSDLYRLVGRQYLLIGCGGIFTAADAYRKIRLGASLVQLVTGLIYQGPQVISQINRGLVKLLERDGFSSIDQVIGVDQSK